MPGNLRGLPAGGGSFEGMRLLSGPTSPDGELRLERGMRQLKIVGVMGSGTEGHEKVARPLGALLAHQGVHLLTGGGGGVMRSVSEGFASVPPSLRRGIVLGILPASEEGEVPQPPAGYPNEFVEVTIRTHLPDRGEQGGTRSSRNSINIATADAVIILPGGAGTASETELARKFRKPLIGFGGGGAAEGIAQAESLEAVELFLKKVLSEPSSRPLRSGPDSQA